MFLDSPGNLLCRVIIWHTPQFGKRNWTQKSFQQLVVNGNICSFQRVNLIPYKVVVIITKVRTDQFNIFRTFQVQIASFVPIWVTKFNTYYIIAHEKGPR